MENSEQTISIHRDHVLIVRPGEYQVVYNEQTKTLSDIAEASNEAGCKKVLVLGPSTGIKLTAFDILELGVDIARYDFQMAFADEHDASNDAMSLFETTVSNRGGAIRFFDNVADARGWLEI